MKDGIRITVSMGAIIIGLLVILSLVNGCATWSTTKTNIKYDNGRVTEQEIIRTDGRILNNE